jgi:hypothetical protein
MPDRIAFVDQQGDTLATATNDILGGQLARLVAEMDALDAEAVVVEALPACELSRREGIGHAVEMLRDALDVTLPAETVESLRNQLFAVWEMVKTLRALVRGISADRGWLIDHADDELVTAYINARRTRTAAARGGPDVAAHSPQEMVAEFHQRPGVDCLQPPAPTVALPGALDRVGYVEEEVRELREAVEAGDVVSTADALADLVYVVYGAAWRFAIPLDAVVREVHRSNMTKDPSPGDGKAIKGPNYEPPDIGRVLTVAAQHPEGGDRG